MIRRREFTTLLGGAAAWPLAASAQQPGMPVIGFMHSGSPESTARFIGAFRKGLSEMGYVEGRNVSIEYRWAYDDPRRLPELVTDLVRHRVAAIAITNSMSAALAVKTVTSTTPTVIGVGGDPVRLGLVTSLNRPGSNFTGINYMGAELGAKRLGLLHELLSIAVRFAVLVNRNNPNSETEIRDAQAAAAAIGLQMEPLHAADSGEIDMAFARIVQERIEALVVSPSVFFSSRQAQLVTLAARHAVPTIYDDREYVVAGDLMNYGPDTVDQARQVGIYTGRVLKGEKPADLPVMRATKFQLVINLQTTKLLGLTLPATLRAIADEVVE
jgi:putative ABC transport system substrate-binding protein